MDTKTEVVESLRSLHDLLKAVNSTLDIDEVVGLILERTARLMRAQRVLILRLAPSNAELLVYRAYGFREGELRLRRFVGVRSFDHCIVHKGTVIHFAELLAEKDYEKAVAAVPPLATMFFAPLEIKGKAYGLLGVSGGQQDFSEIELEIFCALASQAALAIENANLYQRLKDTFHHTAAALAEAVNSRDPYTGGHVKRVRDYALRMATALGMPGQQRDALQLAAILHDIGKIGIDDAILRKGGDLTDDEQRSMRRHPVIGAHILAVADGMAEVVPGVRHHHEWFDGSGYPDGLAGEGIPLSARVIAIVDAFDALTTDRPYHGHAPGMRMECPAGNPEEGGADGDAGGKRPPARNRSCDAAPNRSGMWHDRVAGRGGRGVRIWRQEVLFLQRRLPPEVRAESPAVWRGTAASPRGG